MKKKPKTQGVPEHQPSQETGVQRDSGVLSTVYRFGKWAVGMIVGLFW